MNSKKEVTVKTIGFPTLLLLSFIILKLCNVITWSWWWVLSPLWIPIAISVVIGGIILLLFKKVF
jgi:hypothetical protein